MNTTPSDFRSQQTARGTSHDRSRWRREEIKDVSQEWPTPRGLKVSCASTVASSVVDGSRSTIALRRLSSLRSRVRRGSLTRDRRDRVAPCPVPLSGAIAPLTTAVRDWPVRHDGKRAAHPTGAVARGGSPGAARRASARGPRLWGVTRDRPFCGPVAGQRGSGFRAQTMTDAEMTNDPRCLGT